MDSDQPERGGPQDEALTGAIAAELPRVRRHAFHLLYSRADAENLTQGCLEAALSRKASLRDPDKLRSWLFSILNTLFLLQPETHRRRGQAPPIEEFADSLAASASPEDRHLARDLAHAMAKLSPEHRQILLLLNVEGFRYQEAAEILDLPIAAVMSRLARARRQLRALLEGHDPPVVG